LECSGTRSKSKKSVAGAKIRAFNLLHPGASSKVGLSEAPGENSHRQDEPDKKGPRVKTTILSFLIALSATAAGAASYPAHPQTSPEITAADISARVKAISDNAFEGRG